VNGPDEDVHRLVERVLVERIGEPGRRLHTGRSRNEQVALDLRLYLRRRIPLVQARVACARGGVRTPGRTGRRGPSCRPTRISGARSPVLIAHYWLAHAAAFRRDHTRLGAVRDEAGELTLGSGAVVGTAYAIDVHALAARLGLPRVVRNSLDAASDRDFVASFLHASALSLIPPQPAGRGSGDLRQRGVRLRRARRPGRDRQQPDAAEEEPRPARARAGQGRARDFGRLTGWLTTLKGLPSGYNKDLQEDKDAVFDVEDTLSAWPRGHRLTVVDTLKLHTSLVRRRPKACSSRHGRGRFPRPAAACAFRDAHETVGRLVRRLVDQGRTFDSLTDNEWREASPLFDGRVHDAISAAASVNARTTPQSTHPQAVAASLARCASGSPRRLNHR